MTQRLRVGTRQGLPAATAGRGFARDFCIGGQQGTAMQLVSRLSATAAAGGLSRGAALDSRCITGRGAGGILRVLVESFGEIGHLLTQGTEITLELRDEGKESGLGGGRNQIPKLLGNGRLLRHGLIVGSRCPTGYILRYEPLHRFDWRR